MRNSKEKRGQRATPLILSARLGSHVTLETKKSGEIFACFEGISTNLGKFGSHAAVRADELRSGVPLSSFASRNRRIDQQLRLLVEGLAKHGLLEYHLRRSGDDEDRVVIEPQTPDYRPQAPRLANADVLVLSRFAYMRRRGGEIVLESPLAEASFRICDPTVAATLATLATPHTIEELRRQHVFPGIELFALLLDSQILFKIQRAGDKGVRATEGNDDLVLWDFHDLLFHVRSTQGRHANPAGGTYPHIGAIPSLPAVRANWPGKKIALGKFSTARSNAISPTAKALRERHSTRRFDDENPITLAELSRFLNGTARVQSEWSSGLDRGDDDGGPSIAYTARPYPSAGRSYELELYLAVDKCRGLERGFYHYDAGQHTLARIDVPTREFQALLRGAELAMGASAAPQILITIAARFGRVSWKYSSVAYALILKDVGVLTQTLYRVANDMGLGGCAIGSTDIDVFAKMTRLEFHVEGPVGQFALGRGAARGTFD